MNREAGHIAPLDGVRAIAILLVMVFHFSRGHGTAFWWRVTDIGWAGVDLFFVLSGFLITGILVRTRDSSHYFRDFYARRALRILPLYYGTLVVAFLVLPAFSGCPGIPLREQVPYWLYFANFAQGGGSPCFVLGHFWSLGIEEQFYLVWPIVVLRSSRTSAIRVCIAAILVSLAARLALGLAGAPVQATFSWTFSRLDGLAMGSLTALCFGSDALRSRLERISGRALAISGAVLLAVMASGGSGLVLDESGSIASIVARSGMPLLLAIIASSLLLQAIANATVARVLTFPGSAAIARYSYGAYVFHMFLMPALVLSFPRGRLTALTHSADAATAVFVIAGMTAAIAVAALSYHVFESFFLGLRSQREPGLHDSLRTSD
jgi:peptidoglycan/LPS O-acetylase OafA/YrhL